MINRDLLCILYPPNLVSFSWFLYSMSWRSGSPYQCTKCRISPIPVRRRRTSPERDNPPLCQRSHALSCTTCVLKSSFHILMPRSTVALNWATILNSAANSFSSHLVKDSPYTLFLLPFHYWRPSNGRLTGMIGWPATQRWRAQIPTVRQDYELQGSEGGRLRGVRPLGQRYRSCRKVDGGRSWPRALTALITVKKWTGFNN